jgi:hypothetical protein
MPRHGRQADCRGKASPREFAASPGFLAGVVIGLAVVGLVLLVA